MKGIIKNAKIRADAAKQRLRRYVSRDTRTGKKNTPKKKEAAIHMSLSSPSFFSLSHREKIKRRRSKKKDIKRTGTRIVRGRERKKTP